MKSTFYFTLAVMMTLSMSGPAYAADGHDHSDEAGMKMEDGMMDEEMKKEPMEVGNKICPVSGESVTAMGDGVPVEYEGKIYLLCCSMCKKDFLKNPEKYSKIAEDEVANMKEHMDSESSDEMMMDHDEDGMKMHPDHE